MQKIYPLGKIWALAAIGMALLSACETKQQEQTLESVLTAYEKAIRWSQWDMAVEFLGSDNEGEDFPTPLDLDRLRLFRVTSYEVRSATPSSDGLEFRQAVEIRMFNKSQAVERVLRDRQEWRYDADRKSWFLFSGLPDVTKAR
jgi:hypothetical protein